MREQTTHSVAPPEEAGQPHFEDERTISVPRRVIPLEHLDKNLARKRVWFVVAAFIVAMWLGAASGLSLAYFKLRGSAGSQVTQVDVQPLTLEEALPLTQLQKTLTSESVV